MNEQIFSEEIEDLHTEVLLLPLNRVIKIVQTSFKGNPIWVTLTFEQMRRLLPILNRHFPSLGVLTAKIQNIQEEE